MTNEQRVALWDAINRYAEECGGDGARISVGRMNAVAAVEAVVRDLGASARAEAFREAAAEMRERASGHHAWLAKGHGEQQFRAEEARADVSALRERLREAERERDALRGAVVSGAEWKDKVRASVLDQAYPWSEWPKLAAIFQHRPRVNVYWGELARFVAHAASAAGLAFPASPPPVLDEEGKR